FYGFDLIRLKNGAGNNLDLTSNKLNVIPQIMALNLALKEFPKWRFVFGYILKNSTKFDFQQEHDIQYDVISQSPGLEAYRSKFDYEYSSAEYWGGMAIGYIVNEHISLGLGNYGSYLGTQNQLFQETAADAISPNGTPYTADVLGRLKYSIDHVSILFKPGIDIRYGRFKIGISSMLPSIKIWSKGRIYQSLEASNLNVYNTNPANFLARYPSFVAQGEQKYVNTTWKQTPSIALGVEYVRDSYRLSFVSEYFFPVAEYDLMRGTDNVYVKPAQAYTQNPIVDFMRVKTATYGVLNAGLGLDKKLNETLSLITGFNTDFNNKVPLFEQNYKDYIVSVSPSFWHYLHYSLGICISKAKGNTFLGLTYKYGFSPYNKSFASFSNPSDAYYLSGPQGTNMEASVHGIGFVLGFSNFMGSGLPFKLKSKGS
ncbi:MAG: hypothetical protein K2Q22_17645, partial [Cytophagales bacterium]|nr:hypothetical protein [Cytophagales bacterium]